MRLALHFGAIANADDFQFARPALGDAFDGVVDQRPRQPMHRGLRIVLADRHQVAVLLLDLDAGGQMGIQFALGTLHGTALPSI